MTRRFSGIRVGHPTETVEMQQLWLAFLVLVVVTNGAFAEDCGLPEIPRYGSLNGSEQWGMSDSFSPGTTMFYSCKGENRRLLNGNRSITCSSSGEWTGVTPWCGTNIAINQPVKMSTEYTSRSLNYLTDGITKETESVYCTKVSRMEEHTFSLTVNPLNIIRTAWIHVNTSFSDDLNMKIPTNWSYRLDNSDEHAVFVLTNDLLQPINEFTFTIIALEPLSICEIEFFAPTDQVECGQPGIPLNGKFHLDDKGNAIYSCNEGYQLSGAAQRTCDGIKWLSILPQCEAIKTDSISAPSEEIGTLLFNSDVDTCIAKNNCSPLSIMFSQDFAFLDCISVGFNLFIKWAHSKYFHPSLSHTKGYPSKTSNYSKKKWNHSLNPLILATLIFACFMWDVTSAEDCGLPEIPRYGLLNGRADWGKTDTFVFGTTMSYSCQGPNRRLLNGNGSIVCNSSGRWSGITPWCGTNVIQNTIGLVSIADSNQPIKMDLSALTDGDRIKPAATINAGREHVMSFIALQSKLIREIWIFTKNILSQVNKLKLKLPHSWSYQLSNDKRAIIVNNDNVIQSIDELFMSISTTEALLITEIEIFAQNETSECGSPEIPANGQIKLEDGTVTYSCSEGYQLDGEARNFCNGTHWIGRKPICIPLGSATTNHEHELVPDEILQKTMAANELLDRVDPETSSEVPETPSDELVSSMAQLWILFGLCVVVCLIAVAFIARLIAAYSGRNKRSMEHIYESIDGDDSTIRFVKVY